MKTLFDIGQEQEEGSRHTVLIEVGKDYCCTALLQPANQTISRLRYVSLDEANWENELPKALTSLPASATDDVVVCSALPPSVLFPYRYFKNDYAALDTLYRQPAQSYYHDAIPEWQIINAFSLPQATTASLGQQFPTVRYMHAYTPAIKSHSGIDAPNQLSVNFSERYFRVVLKKGAAVHLVQTYYYKTPLDVVYYLLKIFDVFNLPQQETIVILSGLVEKDSQLFAELEQYVAHLSFAANAGVSFPESEHPAHFFTSVYNLAACVL